MQLSEELEKASEFIGGRDVTEFNIIWLQETRDEPHFLDFIEEVDEDEIAEDGFESLYDLIIACAESLPRLVTLVHKTTLEEFVVFDQNNNSMD